jgi:hypothetical protein
MKKLLAFVICLTIVFLTGCQSAVPISIPQQTETPMPSAALPPTVAPSVTPEPVKTVNITAFCTTIGKDAKTYVPRGTPINIIWGWGASTEAQINDYLENNITTVTLDGKVIEGVRAGGMVKNEKSGLPEVVWYSQVGVLVPGEHTLTYDVKWKKMIDDGTSTYGPGGKNETVHDTCQIIVQ